MNYQEYSASVVIYTDLTCNLLEYRYHTKEWLCVADIAPWSHTDSLFHNGGTKVHYEYTFRSKSSNEPGLLIGKWILVSAIHSRTWYHELNFTFIDPNGNKRVISAQEILDLVTHVHTLNPYANPYEWRIHDASIGILFLRLVQDLANWESYDSLKKLRFEKQRLEQQVASLKYEQSKIQPDLSAKIKVLKSKAKDSAKRLSDKAGRLEKRIAAISDKLPAKITG